MRTVYEGVYEGRVKISDKLSSYFIALLLTLLGINLE
jgi:hypothetical protein